jgi:DNA-binding CsgD family transcriptional regulator
MPSDGYFSSAELRQLARAAELLHDPLNVGTLDDWRAAVTTAFSDLLNADVALFYLRPSRAAHPDGYDPVWSRGLSADQRVDYLRYALNDGGAERVRALGQAVVTQTGVVAGDWDGYNADEAVNRFYLPNHLRDAICVVQSDADGERLAAIEFYRDVYGTEPFGENGEARLRLLLPGLQAALAALSLVDTARSDFAATLGGLGLAVAVADLGGRVILRTEGLDALLRSDPEPTRLARAIGEFAASQGALREGRHVNGSRRTAGAALERVQQARRVVSTTAGSYCLTSVEAPPSLIGGRDGILVRVEPTTPVALPTELAAFGLAPREQQVARLLAAGAPNLRIAELLAISPHTARRHTESVLRKLGAASRAEVGAVLRGDGRPGAGAPSRGTDRPRIPGGGRSS